mmetsp:Transcript_17567/g.39550  ORF Transcript_17567/g.39550 Transcript_17567/m.39550 type:complete len:343 (-) Transcript_17567:43-1071(-)
MQGALRWSVLVAGIGVLSVVDGLAHQKSHELPGEEGGVMLKKEFTVRYAFLASHSQSEYLTLVGLPSLASSHCLAETHLAPALLAAHFIQVLPNYVVYTDSSTQSSALSWVKSLPEDDRSRIRLINLDEDPMDAHRMAPFKRLGLDDRNLFSVRRTLADGDHLSPNSSRLLLGTDISFVSEPQAFIAQASKLRAGQAIYMIDDNAFAGKRYHVSNYSGPQCTGLLGDFIFLGPGLDLSVKLLQEKMLWYASQPVENERIEPHCDVCQSRYVANGYHGIDQFALVMALGSATTVGDSKACFATPFGKYHNNKGHRGPFENNLYWEAVHDKYITSQACGYHDRG